MWAALDLGWTRWGRCGDRPKEGEEVNCVTWAGGGLLETDMAGMWDEAVITPPFCGWEGGGAPPPAT